jgi:hypothetical protein
MSGSEWLKANQGQLIDCPMGKITKASCAKRVALFKTPKVFERPYYTYQYYKCLECPVSGMSDAKKKGGK